MKTVGLLSPNLDETKLVDARRLLPPGVRIRGAGFRVRRYETAAFAEIEGAVRDAFDQLAGERLDFLMLTGELFFAHIGWAHHDAILAGMRARLACPTASVVEAVRAAFADLGLRRIVLAAPFTEDQSAVIAEFLRAEGLEVLGLHSLGLADPTAVWELEPRTAYDAAAGLLSAHPDADGLYLPNNQWRVTSVIEDIERDFGRPVVANTPAWIRTTLAGMGMAQPITGCGRLLALPAA